MLGNSVCPLGEMKRSKQNPAAGTQQFVGGLRVAVLHIGRDA